MKQNVTIRKLDASEDELILKIANWYFEEWDTPIEKTVQRLKSQPNDDTLFQLVLSVENKVVATGGLCNNVNILNVHQELGKFKPWLALLYTEKNSRNNGLGKILLEQIEKCASEEKLTDIYLYTFTAESLYKRSGWIEINSVNYKNHRTVIMKKEL
jgi:GNAT superfamily N-acetyltransferase